MAVRVIDGSEMEPFRFTQPMSSYAGAAVSIPLPETAEPVWDETSNAADIPASSGCVRGFCWAIGLEAAAALGGYAVWYFAHFGR
jgi:hypothetical protein